MKSSFSRTCIYSIYILSVIFSSFGAFFAKAAYQTHPTWRSPDVNTLPYIDIENKMSYKNGVLGLAGLATLSLNILGTCASQNISIAQGYSCGATIFKNGLYVGDWNTLNIRTVPSGIVLHTLRGTGQRKLCVDSNGVFTTVGCN